MFGDWYNPLGQVHHTGEVFADGAALYEAASLDSITSKQRNSWFSQCDDEYVTIWVYMPESAPSDHKMELSARPFGFFPKEEGRNYITVSGLTIENVATQWAPPTAFQTGAIGPNWSKGWIIEKCTVRNSKCSGISIGKRREAQDNRWSIDPIKGGAQTYTEVIFTNLSKDWSKENIGSHIIRNNTIYNCGQTGIVGCMGGAFSTIENNRIFNIAIRNEFTGAEIGGIKLHAGIDVIIKNNVIFNATRGIWFDWESQGVRITRNLLFNNESDDLCLELNHGPMLIDNNISLSYTSILNESQGTAFVHNIFAGATYLLREIKRFSMYHIPHDTAVLGSIFVYGGDDKIYNNIYIGHNKNWYYPGRPATHISLFHNR